MYIGSNSVGKIYKGSTEVNKIYKGSTLLYSSGYQGSGVTAGQTATASVSTGASQSIDWSSYGAYDVTFEFYFTLEDGDLMDHTVDAVFGSYDSSLGSGDTQCLIWWMSGNLYLDLYQWSPTSRFTYGGVAAADFTEGQSQKINFCFEKSTGRIVTYLDDTVVDAREDYNSMAGYPWISDGNLNYNVNFSSRSYSHTKPDANEATIDSDLYIFVDYLPSNFDDQFS